MSLKSILIFTASLALSTNLIALESIKTTKYTLYNESITHQQCSEAVTELQSANTSYYSVTLQNGKKLDIWDLDLVTSGKTVKIAHLPTNGRVALVEISDVLGNIQSQSEGTEAAYVAYTLCLSIISSAKKLSSQ
jgi:hypothetical protein